MSRKLRIAHLFPELLNLYGDGGNIITLQRRCEWRGIECEVVPVHFGHRPDFSDIDIAFIGGGSDREQCIVCNELLAVGTELRSYVNDGGVLLAVCGGYQLLGHSYVMGEETISVVVSDPDGLDAVDVARIKDIVVSETGYTPEQIKIMEAGAAAGSVQTGGVQTAEQTDDAK